MTEEEKKSKNSKARKEKVIEKPQFALTAEQEEEIEQIRKIVEGYEYDESILKRRKKKL